MLQINFVTILFLFIIIRIDGIDEDLFDDLWKTVKPSTSKNFKKQKFVEINAIKEEIVVKNENDEHQNDNKIEMEDVKPKLLQKIKKETFTKRKEPKIELEQLSGESFENEFNEEADQNVSSADHNDSADDAYYNIMESEKRNEMEILNKFNLMKTELRKENFYKNLSNVQFECQIAKKLGTNRNKIYKLKKKLGQKREKRTEESEETKMKLIRKFDQMRKEKICGLKYDKKKRNKSECEIANDLKISRIKIYKWKKEFGVIKKFSTQQKIQKVKQFEKVKEEFKKKFNLKANCKVEIKIAQKIGLLWDRIYRWKRKFGLITRKTKSYTDAEKMQHVKRSDELAVRNPMMSKTKIAEKLGIPSINLKRWTKKFGTKSIR